MGSHSRSEESSSRSSKHGRSSREDADNSSSKRHRSSSHRDRADGRRDRDRDRDSRDDTRSGRKEHGGSSSRRDRKEKESGGASPSSRKHDVSSSRRGSRKDRSGDAEQQDDDDDEWVEKTESTAPEPVARPPVDTVGTFSVGSMPTSTAGLRRMEPADLTDGYGQGDVGGSNERGGGLFGLPGAESGQGKGAGADEADFFGSFGTERKRREPEEKVDPADTMGQSSRELNKAYWQGAPPANAAQASSASAATSTPKSGSPAPGSSGSAWRMTKLKRTYEAAEEEGRPIEEVALDRYGSLEAFEEAKEERRVLDERGDRRKSRRESGYGPGPASGTRTPTGMTVDGGGRRFVFTDMDASGERPTPTSRQSFRRPGETPPAMPPRTTSSSSSVVGDRAPGSASGSRPSTPIPSVFTPPVARRTTSNLAQATVLAPDPTATGTAVSAASDPSTSKPVLSQSDLNKLQARVLKAKLMDADDAAALEAEYEAERKRALEAGPAVAEHEGMTQSIGGNQKLAEGVQVLPTLDGRGRMYDVGVGTAVADQYEAERQAKGRRAKKEPKFETRDPKTGELVRNNADDDALTLDDLVRQERFSGGMNDQRTLDTEVANRIATDARYSTDLDYVDDNAEKFARKKMKSEALKRAFAVGDYARTKKALDTCTLCYSDEGDPPKAPVVALGTRTYLSLMENEELVPGHCRIVPVQHYLSCLEIDEEEGWDEIKNFMKTLMQMFANEDKGVVFFETIVSHKYQKHSYIEAVPVPFDLFDQLPIYFSEAIQTSEAEWSQHKKLISFTPTRPFRRALVSNLPYFAVQFDYKGEKGYGHIIEGVDDAPDRDLDGEESKGQLGDKGGGEFTRYFAHEIIGNLLSLEPRKWRKPRRLDRRENPGRVADFRKMYDRYDWTKMLAQSSSRPEDVEAGPSRV